MWEDRRCKILREKLQVMCRVAIDDEVYLIYVIENGGPDVDHHLSRSFSLVDTRYTVVFRTRFIRPVQQQCPGVALV